MTGSDESSDHADVDTETGSRPEPVRVADAEAGLRLDRWFRSRFPEVAHSHLERLLRTGQVRVDGRRAKAGERLIPGQQVRVPGFVQDASLVSRPQPPRGVSAEDAAELRGRVLHRDQHVLIIDKPAGLAVQGGTKTGRHLDGMLDALAERGERPRMVHRLDKDTSGVLLLACSARAAAALAAAFRTGHVRKLYWAAVVGAPTAQSGRIEQPLAKRFGISGERVFADDDGLPAVTQYRVIERAGRRAAWLALEPQTGRTHQLRAHCALLGTPILGDGKYGGQAAFLADEDLGRQLHLLARTIRFPHPAGGEMQATAPLPPHMRATWRFFGFSGNPEADAFSEPKPERRRPRRRSARDSDTP